MPKDIEMTWDTNLQGGAIAFADNDVKTSWTLLTPVLVSLFTDARAADDDPLPDERETDRGGCWMDATNTALPGDSIGSKLWLLRREKTVDTAVIKAKTYIEDALQWLIDEGAIKTVTVTVEKQPVQNDPNSYILAFSVELKKPDGTAGKFRFEMEWGATVASGTPYVPDFEFPAFADGFFLADGTVLA